MTQLAAWMKANELDDAKLAKRLKTHRTQVSRIRRGISGASKKTAQKLSKLTGIPWHEFIGGAA